MNALIIGAGIHGCSMAVELAELNYNVTIVDKNNEILNGTSYATHNRIHLGYHYPRSIETSTECKIGYDYFIEKYNDCVEFPPFYYMIAKDKSHITHTEYETFMNNLNLPINKLFPDKNFINSEYIESSYITNEGCFNLEKIKAQFLDDFLKKNITTKLGHKISNINDITIESPDLIVNCTYSNINHIQSLLSPTEQLTEYVYEDTEIVVVESETTLPALTVMDGPFVTIMPYVGHKNQYLIYDVVNSRLKTNNGKSYIENLELKSNWDSIKKSCELFFPFINNVKYIKSLYANRPCPLNIKDDSRVTRLIKHDYLIPFYSIAEGKFSTAPMIAKKFANEINLELKCKNIVNQP